MGREQGDEGWLMLTWQDPFAAWESVGWELNDLGWDAEKPWGFAASLGNGAMAPAISWKIIGPRIARPIT